jgi:carboxyl-terminal processing protease
MTRKFGIVAVALIISATIAGGMADILNKRTPSARGTSKVIVSSDVTNDYEEAVRVIGKEYAGDVDYEQATQAAIQGMLWTLDPHSMYFPRTEFNKLKEDQDSRLIGIGVTILRHRDGVYVQSAVEGTPAARAGLRYGDRIVEVDGKDARDWSSDQVSKNVRGERGEPVRVKVERAGSSTPHTFTIIREAVPQP